MLREGNKSSPKMPYVMVDHPLAASKMNYGPIIKKLIENGANLDMKCSRSSPREEIRENLPYFKIDIFLMNLNVIVNYKSESTGGCKQKVFMPCGH